MSWRTVVVTGIAKLDYKLDYLVVRKKDDVFRIHISEVGVLIIDSTAVSVTTMLLYELNKNKVKVILCDEKHNPHAELMGYYGNYDSSIKVKKQIAWSEVIKKTVWTEIVNEKIRNQMKHLYLLGLIQHGDMLKSYLDEIQFDDATNREGHAAKVYFNAIFGKEFTRTSEDSINAALNYGYSIILSCFNREIVANGYLTQLGLFHDNMFNQFNFASDLMEPYRVLVDKKVVGMKPNKFEHDEKIELLSVLSDEVMIDGKNQVVSNSIRIYCKSIFNALNENDISQIKFFRDEL